MLLHRYDGFVQSRVEHLHVVVLQFDLQSFIEVQHRFIRVADLETLMDRPFNLPSREKAIIFVQILVIKKSSLEVFTDDFVEATR